MTDTYNPKFTIATVDPDGRRTTKQVGMELYREAFDKNIGFAEVFNSKFPTDDEELRGTPLEQAQYAAGLIMTRDRKLGHAPPSLAQLRGGSFDVNMAGIVAPDGSDALTVAGRFLFPYTLMQLVTSEMMADNTPYEAAFQQLVAQTVSITGTRYDTPIINYTYPRASRAQPIAQGDEPDIMATISLSSVSQRVKTRSIGLSITDEAAAMSTLDLVGIVLREQAIGERAARLQEDLLDCVNGSTEQGTSALTHEHVDVYDSSITTAGVISHLAWLKWLRKDWKKMNISNIFADISTDWAVQTRSGRPTALGNPGTGRTDAAVDTYMMGMPASIGVFPVDDDLFGAQTIIAIDRSKALRRIVSVTANYQAVERFVLSRMQQFRFDSGERIERVFHDARGWKKLLLTPT
jgi:hypothetical protein